MRSYIEESRIIIETIWYDPIMFVEIENGVMETIPITDESFYDALSELMYFFSKEEEKKIKEKAKIDPNEFEWI